MDIQAKVKSFQSIQVTWNLPKCPNGPISHYTLYYRESDTVQQPPINNEGYMSERINAMMTEFNITGLVAFTNYAIHVQAFGGEFYWGC